MGMRGWLIFHVIRNTLFISMQWGGVIFHVMYVFVFCDFSLELYLTRGSRVLLLCVILMEGFL
jgi:hypothetical protein